MIVVNMEEMEGLSLNDNEEGNNEMKDDIDSDEEKVEDDKLGDDEAVKDCDEVGKRYKCTMCQSWGDEEDDSRLHFVVEEIFTRDLEVGDDREVEHGVCFEESESEDSLTCYGEQEVDPEEGVVECWECGEEVKTGQEYRDHLEREHVGEGYL